MSITRAELPPRIALEDINPDFRTTQFVNSINRSIRSRYQEPLYGTSDNGGIFLTEGGGTYDYDTYEGGYYLHRSVTIEELLRPAVPTTHSNWSEA